MTGVALTQSPDIPDRIWAVFVGKRNDGVALRDRTYVFFSYIYSTNLIGHDAKDNAPTATKSQNEFRFFSSFSAMRCCDIASIVEAAKGLCMRMMETVEFVLFFCELFLLTNL